MLNLLIAIDLEVKFHKWQFADRDVAYLAIIDPRAMRRLFVTLYNLMPGKLLLEFEVQQYERTLELAS